MYIEKYYYLKVLLCLLTDFYYNILIQHNGMDHIKFTPRITLAYFASLDVQVG